MAKTIASRIDFRNIVEIPSAAQKPLYAGVGVGDLAVTAVREYVADVSKFLNGVQKDAQTRVADVQKTVTGLDAKKVRDTATDQAKTRREAVEKRVAELQAEALSLPTKVQSRVQSVVDDNVSAVTSTYDGLAERGKAVVNGTKLPTTASVEVKVNTTVPAARKGATKPAGSTTAATKRPAARTTASKTTAKKAPATKSTATKSTAKKAPAKKAPAKKAPATSTAAGTSNTPSAARKTAPSA